MALGGKGLRRCLMKKVLGISRRVCLFQLSANVQNNQKNQNNKFTFSNIIVIMKENFEHEPEYINMF